MALTAEQKRVHRAERKRARAVEDAASGVKRRPRGGRPLHHRWDERTGAWVLDEIGMHQRDRAPPQLPPPPADLNAWAAANPPPRRDDFESHALFDAAREPWHATIMGKWLPPYGENAARAKAWGLACMRQRERAIAHKLSEERAVKRAEKAAAAAEADRRRQAAQEERAVADAEEAAAAAEAERRRQAERDAADAPLKLKLADCERRNVVEYHNACGQWHHVKVPCADAHLWPTSRLPHNFKQLGTGTMYVEGVGAVNGERTPAECIWYRGRCTGGVHGPWKDRDGCCPSKCLDRSHHLFWAHNAGRHVLGEYVIS